MLRSISKSKPLTLNRCISRRMMSSTHDAQALQDDDVLFQNLNNTKVITLNRPNKLNSLNHSMISKIYPRLREYAASEATQLIIQNSNGRAFCAGGDVAWCVQNNTNNKALDSVKFFHQEYSMNYLLATYNKPVISILNGITMGGGVGLSTHTPFRIATENTRWAMPEMDIGFSPDVGATFALNKLVPSSFGWYLALTGENIFGLDVYFSGLATHYIASHKLPKLQDRLTNTTLPKNYQDSFAVVNSILEEFVEVFPSDYKFKYSKQDLQLISDVFKQDTNMEEIFEKLTKANTEFALKTLETLKKKSPLSLKVGLEILQRGERSDVYAALTNELNAANQFMSGPDSDFNVGVSTKLIQKSRETPKWKFQTIEDVPASAVLPFFKSGQTPALNTHFNITFNQYPHNFGLPKEEDILNYISGKDGVHDDPTSITRSDVLDYFLVSNDKFNAKKGLKQYVEFVLDTKSKFSNSKL